MVTNMLTSHVNSASTTKHRRFKAETRVQSIPCSFRRNVSRHEKSFCQFALGNVQLSYPLFLFMRTTTPTNLPLDSKSRFQMISTDNGFNLNLRFRK